MVAAESSLRESALTSSSLSFKLVRTYLDDETRAGCGVSSIREGERNNNNNNMLMIDE